MNYKITKAKKGFLLETDSIYLDKDFIYPTKLSAIISAELVGFCSVETLQHTVNDCSYFPDYEHITFYIKDLCEDLKLLNAFDNVNDVIVMFNNTINELTKFIEIYFEKYKNTAY